MNSRVHVVIPKDLTDEIDSVVPGRSRSAFICEAVREKLIREKQFQALEKLKTHPFEGGPREWKTDSAGWVRRLRNESTKIRAQRLRKKSR